MSLCKRIFPNTSTDVFREILELLSSESDRMNLFIASGSWSRRELMAFSVLKDHFETAVSLSKDDALSFAVMDGARLDTESLDDLKFLLEPLAPFISKFSFWSGARKSVLFDLLSIALNLETLDCSAFLNNYFNTNSSNHDDDDDEGGLEKLFALMGNLKSLKNLDLSSNHFGASLASFDRTLHRLKNLSLLNLSNNKLHEMADTDFSRLIEAVAQVPFLSHLSLASSDLSDKLHLITPHLVSMQKLSSIDLSDTCLYRISDLTRLEDFFEALADVNLLKGLSLKRNLLSRRIFLLVPVLQRRIATLCHLDCSENLLGEAKESDLEMFFEFICACKHLRSLKLCRNKLGLRISCLSKSVQSLLCLEELKLSGNQLYRCDGDRISEFFAEISLLPSLKSLDLSNNEMHRHLDNATPCFMHMKALEVLSLSHNNLGSLEDKDGFFSALSQCKQLRSIYFDNCRLSGSVEPFTKFIQGIQGCLECISLDGNNLSIVADEELESLYAAIFDVPKLKELNLRCNLITSKLELFSNCLAGGRESGEQVGKKSKKTALKLEKLFISDQQAWLLDEETGAEEYNRLFANLEAPDAETVTKLVLAINDRLPFLKLLHASNLALGSSSSPNFSNPSLRVISICIE